MTSASRELVLLAEENVPVPNGGRVLRQGYILTHG
jgi:hypothetical protein